MPHDRRDPGRRPGQTHPVLASLGWVVIFLLIFVPLANYQYKRAVAR
jgi:hypothetical protein